jgi:hypothetical protein
MMANGSDQLLFGGSQVEDNLPVYAVQHVGKKTCKLIDWCRKRNYIRLFNSRIQRQHFIHEFTVQRNPGMAFIFFYADKAARQFPGMQPEGQGSTNKSHTYDGDCFSGWHFAKFMGSGIGNWEWNWVPNS